MSERGFPFNHGKTNTAFRIPQSAITIPSRPLPKTLSKVHAARRVELALSNQHSAFCAQKLFNLRATQLLRVAIVVMEHEPPHPLHIGQFGAISIVLGSQGVPHAIKLLRRRWN